MSKDEYAEKFHVELGKFVTAFLRENKIGAMAFLISAEIMRFQADALDQAKLEMERLANKQDMH